MAIAFSSPLPIFHRPWSPHHTLLQPLLPIALVQSCCHTLFLTASVFLSCRHHSVSSSVPLPYSSSANLHRSLRVVVPPPPYLLLRLHPYGRVQNQRSSLRHGATHCLRSHSTFLGAARHTKDATKKTPTEAHGQMQKLSNATRSTYHP